MADEKVACSVCGKTDLDESEAGNELCYECCKKDLEAWEKALESE